MSQASAHTASIRRYVVAWAVLLVLTGLTFGLSFVQLGAFSTLVALTIATAKATLVGLVFMHLWEHGGANRLVLLISVLFVVVLIVFTILEVGARVPFESPPGAPQF